MSESRAKKPKMRFAILDPAGSDSKGETSDNKSGRKSGAHAKQIIDQKQVVFVGKGRDNKDHHSASQSQNTSASASTTTSSQAANSSETKQTQATTDSSSASSTAASTDSKLHINKLSKAERLLGANRAVEHASNPMASPMVKKRSLSVSGASGSPSTPARQQRRPSLFVSGTSRFQQQQKPMLVRTADDRVLEVRDEIVAAASTNKSSR